MKKFDEINLKKFDEINLKEFDEINLKEFGDGISGAKFIANTNFTLAAIAKLSNYTTKTVNKDVIVKLTNDLQKKAIGVTTDPKTFDDIFTDLSNKGLIFTPRINLDELRSLTIEKAFDDSATQQLKVVSKKIEAEILRLPMGFNELKLTDIAVHSIKTKHKKN